MRHRSALVSILVLLSLAVPGCRRRRPSPRPSSSPNRRPLEGVAEGGLYAVRSGHLNQLTGNPADTEPAFSPDGRTIAFVRDGDLYSVRPDGSGQRQLTSGPERRLGAGRLAQRPLRRLRAPRRGGRPRRPLHRAGAGRRPAGADQRPGGRPRGRLLARRPHDRLRPRQRRRRRHERGHLLGPALRSAPRPAHAHRPVDEFKPRYFAGGDRLQPRREQRGPGRIRRRLHDAPQRQAGEAAGRAASARPTSKTSRRTGACCSSAATRASGSKRIGRGRARKLARAARTARRPTASSPPTGARSPPSSPSKTSSRSSRSTSPTRRQTELAEGFDASEEHGIAIGPVIAWQPARAAIASHGPAVTSAHRASDGTSASGGCITAGGGDLLDRLHPRRLPPRRADRAGGMGVVYRATHLALDRPVALKVIARQYAGDEAFRAALPARVAARRQPRSPGRRPGLRRPRGGRRADRRDAPGRGRRPEEADRDERALPPAEAVALLDQVAGALDAAHAAGIVHRDVKPHNILLEGDRAYLTDFGLAKALGDSGVLSGASIVGTVEYMSPEQWRGGQVGPAADVYSLGCVLYEALTGVVPYARRESDAEPEMPRASTGSIERAVAKDPAERYATAGELIDAAASAKAPRRRRPASSPTPRSARRTCRRLPAGAGGRLPARSLVEVGCGAAAGLAGRDGTRDRRTACGGGSAAGRQRPLRLRADRGRAAAAAARGRRGRGLGDQRSRRDAFADRPSNRGVAAVAASPRPRPLRGRRRRRLGLGLRPAPRRGAPRRSRHGTGEARGSKSAAAPARSSSAAAASGSPTTKARGVTAINPQGGRVFKRRHRRRTSPRCASPSAPARSGSAAPRPARSAASTSPPPRPARRSPSAAAPPASPSAAAWSGSPTAARDSVTRVDPATRTLVGLPIAVGERPGGIDAGTERRLGRELGRATPSAGSTSRAASSSATRSPSAPIQARSPWATKPSGSPITATEPSSGSSPEESSPSPRLA